MRKTFLLALFALFTTWTVAQPQNNAPNQATVPGCLTGALHQYRLVDDNHLVYRVIGSDRQLDAFAGQQVEITGKLEERIPPKERQTASSFSRPEHRLMVVSITKISGTCTGASE
jgi:hypothetical protein